MEITLYDFNEDFERVKKKIDKMNTPQSNKALLSDFADDCLTGWQIKKISLSRTTTLLQRLSRMTVIIDMEWMQFEERDTKKILRWIDKEYPLPDGAWSQHGYRIALRKFVTWMRRKQGYPDTYSNRERSLSALDLAKYALEVSHIHISEPNRLKDVQTIPSDDEINWISEACLNPRDKAYIEMSRENGERIGGLGTRKIKHINFDSLGALITMHDKTFRGEPVRYITSAMYLHQWIDNHPFKDNPESPLWIDLTKLPNCEHLDYDGFRFLIVRLIERHNKKAKKEGKPLIRNNITTHLFRYYAQTRDEKKGMPRTIMCKLRGWKVDSKQPERYARLSSKDVDDYFKEQYGLKEENQEPAPKVIKCMRCKEINAPGKQYCFKCGLPLDQNAVVQIEENVETLQRLISPEMINSLIDARIKELMQQGQEKNEGKKG